MTGLTATGVGAGGAGAGVGSSARLERGFTSATTRAHTAHSSEKRSRMRCIRALRHGRGAHRAAACPWAGPIPAWPAARVSPPSGGFAYLRAGRAAANDFLTVTVTVKRTYQNAPWRARWQIRLQAMERNASWMSGR